jgi:hypothetical protein
MQKFQENAHTKPEDNEPGNTVSDYTVFDSR